MIALIDTMKAPDSFNALSQQDTQRARNKWRLPWNRNTHSQGTHSKSSLWQRMKASLLRARARTRQGLLLLFQHCPQTPSALVVVVDLIQPSYLGRGSSVEKNASIRLPVGKSAGRFLD